MLYPKKGLDAACALIDGRPFMIATTDYIRVFYASIPLDVRPGITR